MDTRIPTPPDRGSRACAACAAAPAGGFSISMAFQPIVDLASGGVFAYEALVRGRAGEGARVVLDAVSADAVYGFDQACRETAIGLAADLGLPETGAYLSINFLPNAVYEPRTCIRRTLAAARRRRFPLDRLMFELSESELLADPDHLGRIVAEYRAMGFLTAIDDFGAGYSGLGLLSRFQPDVVKLDMQLVRGLDGSRAKRAIVRALAGLAADLDVRLVAEGVETRGEADALLEHGVALQQGYLYARPAFEALPPVSF